MATSNFGNVNVSRYFTVHESKYYTQEDVDANDMDQDMLGEYDDDGTEFNWEWERENIQAALQAKGWDSAANWVDPSLRRSGNNEVIADKDISFVYGGAEISLNIKALACPGYYDGACLDIDGEVEIISGGDAWSGSPKYEMFGRYSFSEEDVAEDDWTGNPGLNKLQAKNIIKRLNDIIEGVKNEAELVFSTWSEHEVFCAGRFNNGESVYCNVQTKLCDEVKDGNKAA